MRPFDRAFEDDKLLAEHGVLDKEVGFGARQIGDGADSEGNEASRFVGFKPPDKVLKIMQGIE